MIFTLLDTRTRAVFFSPKVKNPARKTTRFCLLTEHIFFRLALIKNDEEGEQQT